MDYEHTKLYNYHEEWLKYSSENYDDIIMDLVCKIIQKACNSNNKLQSVCLSSNPKGSAFKPASNSKFAQVMMRTGDNFLVVSNVFSDDLERIEVFDNNASNYLPLISAWTFLNPKNDIARAIKSLKPKAWGVHFVDCKQQKYAHSCGPLALLHFKAILSCIPPHCIKLSTSTEHVHDSILRTVQTRKLQRQSWTIPTSPDPRTLCFWTVCSCLLCSCTPGHLRWSGPTPHQIYKDTPDVQKTPF